MKLRPGYTLVEILVATALSLILMAAVVRVFGAVGTSISNSRAALESADRLRGAAAMLRMDLENITVKVFPPRRPEMAEGYFEYVEGFHSEQPIDPLSNKPDNTVHQRDDILLFTTRNGARPFLGRCASTPTGTIESDVAEVAWFVRGRTLHRRVLLVAPQLIQPPGVTPTPDFFAKNDVSVYIDPLTKKVLPNTLSSLTKRECRFAHPADQFPFDVRRWGRLGLPTLWECSSSSWMAGWTTAGTTPLPSGVPSATTPVPVDLWNSNAEEGKWLKGDVLAKDGTRIGDDVVLTNVIGFDVKAWDSGARTYVDLGSPGTEFEPAAVTFAEIRPDPTTPPSPYYNYRSKSGLQKIFDTWSFHYENEGIDETRAGAGLSTNGFADGTNATGVPDDPAEALAPAPHPVPLRGIQVRIRVFEPDSRQIREVTIVQDFLPK